MPRKKSKKGTVRSAALNVYQKNSKAEQVADLKKALKRADVVSLSEVKSNGLLAWARANGYGVYKATGKGADNALVWNKNRVSLARPGKSIKLNKLAGDDGGERSRFAAYAMFTDKATGTNFWQVAAHTVPMDYDHSNPTVGPGDRRQRRKIRAEQYSTLAQLAKQLSKSGAVILAGDLNAKGLNLNIGGTSGQGWDRMYVLSSGGSVTNSQRVGGLNSDHSLTVSAVQLDGSAGGDGSGKQLLGQYGWVQGMDREEARAADIVGGPGVKPVRPVEADYLPGGRFHGLMAYSVAMEHYRHAMDGYKNGFWYHANGLAYTRAQRDHNLALKNSGKFQTKYGMPTASYAEQLAGRSRHGYYTLENGQWVYRNQGSGTGGPGGGAGGGAGGDGSGPKPGGLTEYRGMAGNAYVAPTFQGFWQGDMGGGPMQVAPGAPPKQNGAPLYAGTPAPASAPATPSVPTTPTVPTTSTGVTPQEVLDKPQREPWGFPVEQPTLTVRTDINPATTQELLSKVSSGYFLENAW
jgi:hypothetical protein